jgi:hypothetical protein
MPSSRRTFLKTTLIASASAAIPSLTALGESPSETLAPAIPATITPFSRGIGAYPGAPGDFFGPSFVIDSTTYRNLALHRPASHSSAYDYNLTAQLVTDGIIDTTPPTWISTATSTLGTLDKTVREVLTDHWEANTTELKGGAATATIQLGGGTSAPEIDAIGVFVVASQSMTPAKIRFTLSASDDGREWEPVATITGPVPIATDDTTFPPDILAGSHLYHPRLPFKSPLRKHFYQLEVSLAGVAADANYISWKLGQLEFFRNQQRVQIGGPYSFTSAWMSAGLGEEWVAVDLGAPCSFDRITLHWIARAAEGTIQTSNDGTIWTNLKPLPAPAAGSDQIDDIHLAVPAHARHIRVLMTRPSSPEGYILSEFQVFGRGGPVPRPAPASPLGKDGKLNLAGGRWRLERDSQVQAGGTVLAQPGFKDDEWLPATVPGTILTSYVNAGAVPDPNYGQNQLYISDSYFHSDFWYRTEFTPAATPAGKLEWLNFDGINWKAEVFLNGESIGRIDGGFTRARFNVTGKLKPGKPNALAVRVETNATPGSCKQKTYETPGVNGGALGADNPTFHASIGWDWIPTIRGRNTGIWGIVWLESTGALTLDAPGVSTTFPNPDHSSAIVKLDVFVQNHRAQPVTGILHYRFGELALDRRIVVPASPGTSTLVSSTLEIKNPKLWWPVGYGDPDLYDVELTLEVEGKTSDHKSFKAGIRQMTFTEDDHNLKLFINGRRFVPRGGNWGFAESMLLYRAREYDAAVRYHREMNFTMIRNWVGQIPDDAFFEACDKHGVVVWQDFWLANPWDGPIPNDDALFLANARDYVLRIRQHASIGLYCGRNEGYPPPTLEAGIRKLLGELHPDIHYIGSSADDVVSGHGPYRALPPTYYFEHTDTKFHSEIGMPNVPNIESVRAMMPASAVWPQGLEWGLHDFCLNGAQGGASFLTTINNGYGGAHSAEEWTTLAQFVNYEGYRAIFEAGSSNRMGILLWMSHPCWPSFVWQTYDYYLEPTAAYFGCKKASEPLHIQWNRFTGFIEVVNLSAGDHKDLTAELEILNLDGSTKSKQTAQVSSLEDSVGSPIKVTFPSGLSSVHILRLTLHRTGTVLSTNLYLRGIEEGNLRAIRQLAKVHLTVATTILRKGDLWTLTTELTNPTTTPALMVRLKAVREIAGDRILPVIYTDNYVTLMPGEHRTLITELNHADTRGQKPKIVISGFNIA